MHDSGRSAIVARGLDAKSWITYNDIHRFGWLSYDLGGIYIGWRKDSKGTEVAYNWFHDSKVIAGRGHHSGPGIYNDGNWTGRWHHNVIWNTGGTGMHVNPRDYLPAPDGKWKLNPDPYADMEVFNNTCLSSGLTGAFKGGRNLKVYNNILAGVPVGDDQRNNILNAPPLDLFADPYAGDLRLKPGSPAIDAGMAISGITDDFKGKAPDAGAYESGKKPWVPGANPKDFPEMPAQQTPRPPRSAAHIAAGAIDEVGGRINPSASLFGTHGGDWACYRSIDFGAGVATCDTDVAVDGKYAGGRVEFRLGSKDGKLIGTLTVADTGGFGKYAVQKIPVEKTSGVHDLFVIFKGGAGIGNFSSFGFQ